MTGLVIQLTVTETSRYAKSYVGNNSYIGKWKPVEVPKIKNFFGIFTVERH